MSILEVVEEIEEKCGVYSMEHAGFSASLMRAERLQGENIIHKLPPGQAISVFPIATLPGCPDGWVKEAGTYVCPVDSEWGLWFDWRKNDIFNTAVVPSVKGMNPITGQKLEGFSLEMYADKCPVHDVPFSHGRICEECGYEWPAQNYISSPNTLWWDGFRQPDGSVRQFFFTDEDVRDVSSAVIGKENTTPAFGFAFYQPKVKREDPRRNMTRGASTIKSSWIAFCKSSTGSVPPQADGSHCYTSSVPENMTMSFCDISDNLISYEEEKTSGGIVLDSFPLEEDLSFQSIKTPAFSPRSIKQKKTPKKSKSVSVGAGAKIDQELAMDGLGIDGWRDEHSGAIRLYFCFEQEFKEIVKNGGVKELSSNPEGYLKEIPVG